MRRLWQIGIGLVAISAIALAVSLFNYQWISGDGSTMVRVGQGCLTIWFCSPGDWSAWAPGISGGQFHGVGSWMYKPEFQRHGRIFVPAQLSTPGTTGPVMAKGIWGMHIRLPLYIPLVVGGLLMAAGWPGHRRQRRRSRGCCESCGYDLRASPGACPECGGKKDRVRPAPS